MKGRKNMDARNHDVTTKIFDVLDNVKGFEVAMANPKAGKILARYQGTAFVIEIDPLYNDNDAGRDAEKGPFEDIVRKSPYIFK